MWQQIKNNKRNSIILITGMLFLIMLIGTALGGMFAAYTGDLENFKFFLVIGIVAAVIIWLCLLLSALKDGKKSILSTVNAYKLPPHAHLVLENVVEEMSIAAGLPKVPEIYVIDTEMPNAFATGLSPEKSAVAVTTGLLAKLNRDELQGVIAHEIAHIVNRDTMYMLLAGVMIGSIVIMCEFGLRTFSRSCRSRRSSKNSGGGELIVLLICILAMVIAPIVAELLYFLISQRREYLADACAAQFTRYPAGLASALAKISCSNIEDIECNIIDDYGNTEGIKYNKIVYSMFTVNPKNKESLTSMFNNCFSTHPPTQKRIDVLLKMNGADYKAYNEAFAKVSGSKSRTILDSKDLKDSKRLKIRTPLKEVVSNTATMSAMPITETNTTNEILPSVKTKTDSEILTRKREAEDAIWHSQEYIFKQCECGTKLKFPKDYEGQEIACPHCKRIIKVSKNS